MILERQGVAIHTLILLFYGLLSFLLERQEGAIITRLLKRQGVAILLLILLFYDIIPFLLERQGVPSSPSF